MTLLHCLLLYVITSCNQQNNYIMFSKLFLIRLHSLWYFLEVYMSYMQIRDEICNISIKPKNMNLCIWYNPSFINDSWAYNYY